MNRLISLLCISLLACTLNTTKVNPMIDYETMDVQLPAAADTGGWSASGELITGDSTKQVTLQVVFPKSDVYTVQFNAIFNPDSSNPIRAEALVVWSVAGNSVTRRVSIANGTSISGVGAGVRIVLTDNTKRVDNAPAVNTVPYTVSVQVAPGSRASVSQAPLLLPSPSNIRIPIGPNTVDIDIPQDAGVIQAYLACQLIGSVSPPVDGDAVAVFLYGSVGIAGFFPTKNIDFVPVPPGATTIRVQNNNTTYPMLVETFFGIDG